MFVTRCAHTSAILSAILLASCQATPSPSTHGSAPDRAQDAWSSEGTAVIEGYAEIGRGSTPYIFFVLKRSHSSGFTAFLGQLHGNAFGDLDRIGIGCRTSDGIVVHRYDAWGEVETVLLPLDTARAILASTPRAPIALMVRAPALPGGGAAPPCYSHLSEIEIL